MDIDDPKIVSLNEYVEAACQEVEWAIQFHEAWRPAAFDQSLLDRIGHSYAANTFLGIREALRREVVLALMRLWDNNSRALNLKKVADDLANPDVIDAFARDRASRLPIPGAEAGIRKDMQKHADVGLVLIRKYLRGGSHADVLLRLRTLRNEWLAHRQMARVVAPLEPGRDDVEELYKDMLELVGRLFHLVKATAYDLGETVDVFRHNADLFWEAVRGERTEGHPRYRAKSP